MAAAVALRRNEAIVVALSKRLSLVDPEKMLSSKANVLEEEKECNNSILVLLTDVLQLSPSGEVRKWVKFAEDLPLDSEGSLRALDEALAPRAVLAGDGLKPSEADVVVFSSLHAFLRGLSATDTRKYPNVMRWMDYIQNKEDFGGVLGPIVIEKSAFHLHEIKNADMMEPDQSTKTASQDLGKKAKDVVSDIKKSTQEKAPVENKPSMEKKKKPEKAPSADKSSEEKKKEAEVSVSALNIQVGLICKAWKHPSADSLLVEEIDLGDGNLRQVVSGLAKYCSPDQLINRRVVLITNVRPGKLRDVMSTGLVLCASNEDHTVVEPLLPPEGAVPGERISFAGYEGMPEDVLNPKKKQLEKITPYLYTDNKGIATYRGVPFMTLAGPCTSSIPKAGIK